MSTNNNFQLIVDSYKYLKTKDITTTYKNIIVNQQFNYLIKDLQDKGIINDEMTTKIHNEFYNQISYLF